LAVLSGFELCFERIGLEACSLTAWMHEGLRSAGLPAICIESRHAKAAMGAMPNKTDRNDARALAQIMRTAGSAKFMSRAHHVVPGALFS
jgi:transposase